MKKLNISSRIILGLHQKHHLPFHFRKCNLGVLRTFPEKTLGALELNRMGEKEICVLVTFVCLKCSCVTPLEVLSSSVIRRNGLGKRNCEFLH